MSSSNGSGRPAGSVSIPVEIIRDSNPTGPRSHSRQNSPFRPIYNDGTFGGFADSPPWGSNSTSRFQPRHSPNSAYDRLINNSQFNQPHNEHVSYPQYQEAPYRPSQTRLFEGSPSQLRRSNDDLLSAPFESMHFNAPQPQFSTFMPPFATGFPSDSDFVQPIRFPSQQRRSYEALNDFPDMHQSFPSTRQYPTDHGPSPQQQPPPPPPSQQQQQPQQQQHPHYRSTFQTQHQPSPPQQQQQQQPTYGNQPYNNPNIVYLNEYGVPTDHYQPNTFQGSANNMARDRSHSPAAPRGASPAQQPQPQPQPQEEPELKMAKDADGPIPMPAPASSSTASASSAQSIEPQVPPSDTGATANTSSTPPPEPARDPNSVALEKLAQIKQTLNTLEKEVDAFTGSTRHERAYKVLDEQALKIMIRCDELVDISADIRAKRKEMIRDVQRVIGKLESKVPGTPAVEQNSNPLEAASTSDGQSGAAAHNESTPGAQSSSPTAHNDTSSAATEQSRTG